MYAVPKMLRPTIIRRATEVGESAEIEVEPAPLRSGMARFATIASPRGSHSHARTDARSLARTQLFQRLNHPGFALRRLFIPPLRDAEPLVIAPQPTDTDTDTPISEGRGVALCGSINQYLRAYQQEGVQWIARRALQGCGGLLADVILYCSA